MKKRAKAGPDIAELVAKMQEQLISLEKKIDTLISQPPVRQFSPGQNTKPFQRFERSHHHGEPKEPSNYRERVLHKAICADCNAECEVPFRPTGDRPVYCKECFSKRKTLGPSRGNSNNNHAAKEPFYAGAVKKHFVSTEGKKAPGRKKASPKKKSK